MDNIEFYELNLGKLANYRQYFGSNNVEGVAESWVEDEMSWMEVDGGGSNWVHGLVIPIFSLVWLHTCRMESFKEGLETVFVWPYSLLKTLQVTTRQYLKVVYLTNFFCVISLLVMNWTQFILMDSNCQDLLQYWQYFSWE